MSRMSVRQRELIDNAPLFASMRLIFDRLRDNGTSTVSIKDVADTASGGTPSRSVNEYFGGHIPWVKSGELEDGPIHRSEEFVTERAIKESSAKVFREGTVVIAMYGATVGRTGILQLDAATNQAVCAVIPKSGQIDRDYLFWFLRSKRLDYLSMSFGGAQPNISQRIIRESELPLPSLAVQSAVADFLSAVERRQHGDRVGQLPHLNGGLGDCVRIVARIEELTAKIEEARGLRASIDEGSKALVTSLHFHLSGERIVRMHEILDLDEDKESVQFGHTYPQVGVRGFGQGLFAKESVDASATTYKAFNRLYDGAVVLSQVKGWEGAIDVCDRELAGRFVSPEYRTFRCIPGLAAPRYVATLVKTPWFWEQLKGLTRGQGARRERVRPELFLKMELPMPTIDDQIRASAVFDRIQTAACLRRESAAELDALLPSVLDRAFKGEL